MFRMEKRVLDGSNTTTNDSNWDSNHYSSNWGIFEFDKQVKEAIRWIWHIILNYIYQSGCKVYCKWIVTFDT